MFVLGQVCFRYFEELLDRDQVDKLLELPGEIQTREWDLEGVQRIDRNQNNQERYDVCHLQKMNSLNMTDTRLCFEEGILLLYYAMGIMSARCEL